MGVTLITTVKNEEKSIQAFLASIKEQTLKPAELIIVDAYSRDKTVELIYEFAPTAGFPVILVKKRGNRSVGRNKAVRTAKHDVIAATDAGCIPESLWLERLTRPFADDKIDVVAGFYKPQTQGVFEECLSTYTCTMPDKLNRRNFLPSSRSVAFRKKAWKKVKGYPENLDTCEDLVFDKKLKKAGFTFMTVSAAVVLWPQRKNILTASGQFFSYAKGDGKAHYFRLSTPFLYLRYLLGLLLVIFLIASKTYELIALVILLVLVYITWSIQKNYRYIKKGRAFLYLPILQFVSDMCVLSGTTVGFIYSFKR